ncbi:MAG TPA: PAS domain S-box protein [Bacteroidales bacterium]|nr:PAS domain S-box protein [Bacteroidales bacterium]
MKSFLRMPPEFDRISDGWWDLDVKNDKICLSQNASRLCGKENTLACSRESVLNDFIHKEHRDLLHEEIEKLLNKQNNILDIEIRLEPKSRECRWVHVKGVPVSTDPDGMPDQLFGTITDITRYKKADKDIEKERKILRTIIDNLPATIYVLDKKGRKVLSNKADLEIIGAKDKSEVLGRTDLELYPGFIGERGHKDNMDVINNKAAILNREEDFSDKNGNQRWLLTSMIPLLDQDDQATGLVGIGVDITEQKQLQKKISESENFYRTLVNISPNGVIVTDLDGNVSFVSKRAYQIFEVAENKILAGENVFNWLSPDSFTPAKANFRDVVEGKRPPQIFEYKALKFDRSEFWAEFSSSLVFDFSGRPSSLMIVCRDITFRKKIEEDLISAKNKAEENDKLKTAFLHNISHEIRTPLNGIVGFTSLLDDPDLSKDQRQSFVEIIKKSSDHLLAIISDIIEISNIEAGIIKINENELNLNALIEDLYSQFKLDATTKNIQLIRSFGIWDEKVIIRSDKTKLVQVLSNLLCNSLKFTESGLVKFGYRVKENFLEFFVSDTGIGIPEEKLDKIFDRFYQVDYNETRQHDGTGLGLSISKAYVELLGGKIWLDSKVGKGTTFFFTVPLNLCSEPTAKNGDFPSAEPGVFLEGKTFLIAEDDENNYKLICEMLKSSGVRLLRAKDGIEAVEMMKSVPGIDLVLMDIKLPNKDGFKAAKRIKEFFPDLPVIALTAYSSNSDKETALKMGFEDFISKPYTLKVLIDSLRKINF